MKIQLKVILIICPFLLANGQKATAFQNTKIDVRLIVSLKTYYDGQGVIFTKNTHLGGRKDGDKQINLTLSEVINAETILDSVTDIKFMQDSLILNKIKEKRRKWYRQYWGIQNENGEKIVKLIILNFTDPKLPTYFPGWYEGELISTGDYFAQNTRAYRINLTTRSLEKDSFPLVLSYRKNRRDTFLDIRNFICTKLGRIVQRLRL